MSAAADLSTHVVGITCGERRGRLQPQRMPLTSTSEYNTGTRSGAILPILALLVPEDDVVAVADDVNIP